MNGSQGGGPAAVTPATAWEERWQRENRELSVRNTRVLAVIAAVLVPLCSVLDAFAYPQLWWKFFAARMLVVVLELVLLGISHTGPGQRHYRLLMLLVPLVPAAMIAWMMHHSGDPASPYYAGLTLCLVGVGYLYQWNRAESVIAVLVTVSLHLAATTPLLWREGLRPRAYGDFVNNGIFLLANSLVVISGSLVHHRIRRNEASARYRLAENQKELEARNAELERTLEELGIARRELILSEKMASLGLLSAGIMHEVNNPLNFVQSALYMLDRRASKLPDDARAAITDIAADLREGLTRIASIVADLRVFSHPDASLTTNCEVKIPFQSAARMIAAPMRDAGISVHFDAPEGLVVRGDRNQLTLVFVNLLKNALDAILAAQPKIPNPEIRVTAGEEAGRRVRIEVRDNGPGIPPDQAGRVFDPFFTTKVPGEGTGLGLALCYRIIAAHGGEISVTSTPGEGATFAITLPAGTGLQGDGGADIVALAR